MVCWRQIESEPILVVPLLACASHGSSGGGRAAAPLRRGWFCGAKIVLLAVVQAPAKRRTTNTGMVNRGRGMALRFFADNHPPAQFVGKHDDGDGEHAGNKRPE
jgi:hypothetical protein